MATPQGVPPPPGVACRARRGIVANRVRRGATDAVKSLPVQPWGEACLPCTLARRAAATGRREAQAPTLPWRAAADAQYVLSFPSNWSAYKPQWDQNFSVCWIIVYARSVLVAPPPCEACAARQGVPPPSGVAFRYRCGARSAVHAPAQGLPPPLGDSRRRRSVANAAVVCRSRRTVFVRSFSSNSVAARQAPVSRLA